MAIDPAALASITAAVSLLGKDCMAGLATDAGKSAWAGIKSLFGWTSDPDSAEIPQKVADSLTSSPDIVEQLLTLLQSRDAGTPTALVGNIEMKGGKVVVANTLITEKFQM
jgi:hypothetical protein